MIISNYHSVLDSLEGVITHRFSFAFLLASLIAVFALFIKALTKGGALTTFIFALIIFGLGGWKWTIPIVTFFLTSSLLTNLRKSLNKNVEVYFEKSGARDEYQVIANGGVCILLVIVSEFFQSELFYLMFVSSLAVVCADTWATELGTMGNYKTYDILSLKQVEQGTSGGISAAGTTGAVLGALVISLSAQFWISFDLLPFLVLVIISGVAGSFVDSILGSTIQAQYRCDVCGKNIEAKIHCGKISTRIKGIKWIGNDVVNFAASLSGAIFGIIIFEILSSK